MAIEKRFARELRRMQRIPERALYRQSMKLTRSMEKGMQGKGVKKSPGTKKKIAREVLWLLGSIVASLFIAFIIFYLFGALIPDTFLLLAQQLGLIALYYVIAVTSLAGIYIARLMVWAIKTLTK